MGEEEGAKHHSWLWAGLGGRPGLPCMEIRDQGEVRLAEGVGRAQGECVGFGWLWTLGDRWLRGNGPVGPGGWVGHS